MNHRNRISLSIRAAAVLAAWSIHFPLANAQEKFVGHSENDVASSTATITSGQIKTTTQVNVANAIKDGVENTPDNAKKSFFGAIKQKFQEDRKNGNLPGQNIKLKTTSTSDGVSMSLGAGQSGGSTAKQGAGSPAGTQFGLPLSAWLNNGDTIVTPQGVKPTLTGYYIVAGGNILPITDGKVGAMPNGRAIYPYTGASWDGHDHVTTTAGVDPGHVYHGQYVEVPSGYLPVINQQVRVILNGSIQYNLVYTGDRFDEATKTTDELWERMHRADAAKATAIAPVPPQPAPPPSAARAEAMARLEAARARAEALRKAADAQALALQGGTAPVNPTSAPATAPAPR